MIKGTAFWRRDDDSPETHLRFIISELDVDGIVLVVGMTSWKNTGREDCSGILVPGDHDCINKKSWIKFDKAFEIDYLSLLQEKVRGEIQLVTSLSPSCLSKIQAGAKATKALRRKLKKHFANF